MRRQLIRVDNMPESHVSLSLAIASVFVSFAIDLACTGDPMHAWNHIRAGRKDEQDDELDRDNLFWD